MPEKFSILEIPDEARSDVEQAQAYLPEAIVSQVI
jgi:hypothetical protein